MRLFDHMNRGKQPAENPLDKLNGVVHSGAAHNIASSKANAHPASPSGVRASVSSLGESVADAGSVADAFETVAPRVAAATAGASSAVDLPTTAEVRSALDHDRYRRRFGQSLRSTVFILVVVAAAAVLVAVLLLPVLRIYGTSMHETLDAGDVVVSVKTTDFNTGDVVAFYYNNNILVKRVIAQSGQWVDIDQDGNVYVDGKKLDEPYLSSKAYGQTNIQLPYQVPDGKVFVMGDNREVSIDSRNTAVGCVASEQIVGKIVFRLWPFQAFGTIR